MRNCFTIIIAIAGVGVLGCERKGDDTAGESQTIEQGIEQAGKALERGAEKAGAALERGVDQARPTVERGVEKVGDMLEQGAEKAGPAIEQGVKKLGNALERGVKETGAALAEPSEKAGAEASFESAPGVEVDGDAKFYAEEGKVRVVVNISAAPPGPHGIHIHQKGDCSDIKGKSMGEHFDTRGHAHGLPGASKHHLGDLGNIQIDAEGSGKLDLAVPAANLQKGDKASFVGKAIVIHAAKDVGKGPSGNSGDPIACGVIQAK